MATGNDIRYGLSDLSQRFINMNQRLDLRNKIEERKATALERLAAAKERQNELYERFGK